MGFLSTPKFIDAQIARLAGAIVDSAHERTEETVRLLSDAGRLEDLRQELLGVQSGILVELGYPVVYAVRVEAEWFAIDSEVFLKLATRDRLPAARFNIPAKQVMARVDYPDGVAEPRVNRRPRNWLEAREP
jgi:hypothetical protein